MNGGLYMAQKTRRVSFFMELEGRERVVLTGCAGIESYTEDRVALRTSFGAVIIYGQHLEMGCMTVDGAVICGGIQRIELQ